MYQELLKNSSHPEHP